MVEAGPTVAVPPFAVAAVTGAAVVEVVVASAGAVTGEAVIEAREPDAPPHPAKVKPRLAIKAVHTQRRRGGSEPITMLDARSERKGSRLQPEASALDARAHWSPLVLTWRSGNGS